MKNSKIVALLGAFASSADFAQAVTFSPQVDVESRSLEEIYAAARQEIGPLQVFYGGDGEFLTILFMTQN